MKTAFIIFYLLFTVALGVDSSMSQENFMKCQFYLFQYLETRPWVEKVSL